jgi:hypothetical protein
MTKPSTETLIIPANLVQPGDHIEYTGRIVRRAKNGQPALRQQVSFDVESLHHGLYAVTFFNPAQGAGSVRFEFDTLLTVTRTV